MIVVDNLSKSYGKQALFDAVSFKVNRRERVGVVGRNGHGKTTLFRMITGEEEPDEGTITMPRNYRIGYVEQRPRFTEPTVLAEGGQGPRPRRAQRDLARREGPRRSRIRGRRPGEEAVRALGRLSGPPQPGQGPGRRLPDAPPRRAEQLPRHHLDPLAGALPRGLARGAHAHHPRPQLHGQRRDPRPGHPPPQGPQDRGRHGQALRADRRRGGDLREDAAQRRAQDEGDGAVHHPLPGQGPARRPGPVADQDPREDGEAGEARGDQEPRVRLRREARRTTSTPWTSATSPSPTRPTGRSSGGSRSASGPRTGSSSSAGTAGARRPSSGSWPGTSSRSPAGSTRPSRSPPATSSRPTSRRSRKGTPSSRRSPRPTPRAIPSGPGSSPAG